MFIRLFLVLWLLQIAYTYEQTTCIFTNHSLAAFSCFKVDDCDGCNCNTYQPCTNPVGSRCCSQPRRCGARNCCRTSRECRVRYGLCLWLNVTIQFDKQTQFYSRKCELYDDHCNDDVTEFYNTYSKICWYEGEKLRFDLPTPFYQKNWFVILMVFLGAMCTIPWIGWYFQRKYDKLRELQKNTVHTNNQKTHETII